MSLTRDLSHNLILNIRFRINIKLKIVLLYSLRYLRKVSTYVICRDLSFELLIITIDIKQQIDNVVAY